MLRRHTVMFGGKGGVGKTTCAAATALQCAQSGEPTLVISTDPTPSLADIFEVGPLKEQPVQVRENLFLAELGLREIKEMWDLKFGREVYEVFSAFVSIDYREFVDFISSILPGLAEEFMVDYIRELGQDGRYQRIIWDTAPLGQTLGLLKTPGMLREHLKPAPRIYSRLRLGDRSRRPILEIIRRWEELSRVDLEFLQAEVQIVLVLIPEALAVRQLDRIFSELRGDGLEVSHLIVNGVVKPAESDFLTRRAQQQESYLRFIRGAHQGLGMSEVPLFPQEVKGLVRLEEVCASLFVTPDGAGRLRKPEGSGGLTA